MSRAAQRIPAAARPAAPRPSAAATGSGATRCHVFHEREHRLRLLETTQSERRSPAGIAALFVGCRDPQRIFIEANLACSVVTNGGLPETRGEGETDVYLGTTRDQWDLLGCRATPGSAAGTRRHWSFWRRAGLTTAQTLLAEPYLYHRRMPRRAAASFDPSPTETDGKLMFFLTTNPKGDSIVACNC